MSIHVDDLIAASNPVEEVLTTSDAPEANAAPTVFAVVVADLHSASVSRKEFPSLAAAINEYRTMQVALRASRAYVQLDDYNWVGTFKLRGGLVRVIAITADGRVKGRAKGAELAQAQPMLPALG